MCAVGCGDITVNIDTSGEGSVDPIGSTSTSDTGSTTGLGASDSGEPPKDSSSDSGESSSGSSSGEPVDTSTSGSSGDAATDGSTSSSGAVPTCGVELFGGEWQCVCDLAPADPAACGCVLAAPDACACAGEVYPGSVCE
jgi:hypothetical protein